MTRIYTASSIARPVEQVFDYVTTPANWPHWHPSSLGVSGATNHSLEVGEQVTEEFLVAGRRGRAAWTVRERESPRRWVVDGRVEGSRGGGTITYSLAPHDGGTRFEREFVYAAPSLSASGGRVLDRLVLRHRIQAESDLALRRLKIVLERGPTPPPPTWPRLDLPPELEAVFDAFRTCELSTLARDGTPITWPTLPFWQPEQGRFLITTSIGLAQKALNVRRDGRVSLLFSDPTASGLDQPPAVLVQGDAVAPDEVVTAVAGSEAMLRRVLERQPTGGAYSGNPLLRALFDWYYMRLMIYVRPRRIFWWPQRDFARAPERLEVGDVA